MRHINNLNVIVSIELSTELLQCLRTALSYAVRAQVYLYIIVSENSFNESLAFFHKERMTVLPNLKEKISESRQRTLISNF